MDCQLFQEYAVGHSVIGSAEVQVDYIHKMYEITLLLISNYMQAYLKFVIYPVTLYIINFVTFSLISCCVLS